jgi:chromosome segregation ATPase
LKEEAERKTAEALCSLTAAHEKCNTLQDEQMESEERQRALDIASEESRYSRERDLLKMQDDLTERLSEAESEKVSIAWALSILKSRKAETDEKLERALEELATFEESRTDDLLVSAAIRSETEVAVLTVALAEAKAEIESALLDSEDKIGCLTEALEESKKKIEILSSEIEGLRGKLEEVEAKNSSLESALGVAESSN